MCDKNVRVTPKKVVRIYKYTNEVYNYRISRIGKGNKKLNQSIKRQEKKKADIQQSKYKAQNRMSEINSK